MGGGGTVFPSAASLSWRCQRDITLAEAWSSAEEVTVARYSSAVTARSRPSCCRRRGERRGGAE
eukprot:358544-Chlamydomonas_euryale.AAC.3